MQVTVVPCLSDNYAYLLRADGATDALVVDPSEAEPVFTALAREGLRLVGILNTHHHHDHVGGNDALVAHHPGIDVVAFEGDRGRIPRQTRGVTDGGSFEAAGLSFRTLHVPGHTTGAIAYVTSGAVFTGDTMFVAGCGRLFEGTPADMYASLNEKLAMLPGDTKIYCGHEYTVQNLRFAASIDTSNGAVTQALDEATSQRERGEPTVPSTVEREKATSPFLRVASEPLRGAFGGGDPISVLAGVRRAKDVWRG